ncbi:MAG: hypothetical protein EP329_26045 [Deltaproteobacteria bacterium]|nr:MAG: hypothetical protein EP329_26045 [Deltaproteobacteria bacterium]
MVSYAVLGAGLGASAPVARVAAEAAHAVAPAAMEANEYMGGWFDGGSSLVHYLVFMVLGVALGGVISARLARRVDFKVERGPRASTKLRLVMALGGGVLIGFASRLAAGCTSGQALSGSAMLLTGSLVFTAAIFVGGFASAPLFKKVWN